MTRWRAHDDVAAIFVFIYSYSYSRDDDDDNNNDTPQEVSAILHVVSIKNRLSDG